MMKPVESLSVSLALPAASAPARRDDEDLRDTAYGVEQAAALPPDAAHAARDFSAQQLEAAINQRIEKVLGTNLRLRVENDRESGKFVYMSVDKMTGEVQRQWPSEEVLRTLAFFRELDGLLFDKQA